MVHYDSPTKTKSMQGEQHTSAFSCACKKCGTRALVLTQAPVQLTCVRSEKKGKQNEQKWEKSVQKTVQNSPLLGSRRPETLDNSDIKQAVSRNTQTEKKH